MKFDFGDVLSRAGQITWRHKVLWFITALPILPVFLVFPLMFIPFYLSLGNPKSFENLFNNPVTIAAIIGLEIVFAILSFGIQGISRSAVTLGILRAENNIQGHSFIGLLKDGYRYFWRILGTLLLISLGILSVFFAIFACMALFGAVTMGLGMICIQPFFILLMPISLLVMALMEQAEAGIVADDLGVMDAIRRAYELIKSNFWGFVLVTLVVYIGISIVSSFITFPFMLPFLGIMFSNISSTRVPDPRSFLLPMMIFIMLFFPVIAFVQGIGMTFMKSSMVVIYLRLTRKAENQPVQIEANA